jgi:DNA repair protein RecO (recombination protein O)
MIGKGELKTVRQVEAPSPGFSLRGEALIHGLYINELLVRLLPRFDALPYLFVEYGRAAERLGAAACESTLRRFELALLSELGYRLNLRTDENGEAIQEHGHYRLESERGLCIVTGQLSSSEPAVATGRQILRMQQWWDEELVLERDDLATLKRLTRVAMTQLTSGRTLHTQALVRNLRSHQRN